MLYGYFCSSRYIGEGESTKKSHTTNHIKQVKFLSKIMYSILNIFLNIREKSIQTRESYFFFSEILEANECTHI